MVALRLLDRMHNLNAALRVKFNSDSTTRHETLNLVMKIFWTQQQDTQSQRCAMSEIQH